MSKPFSGTPMFRRSILPLVLAIAFAFGANASMQYRIANDALAPLTAPVAPGSKISVANIPIDGEAETLELEEFQLFTKDAEIRVVGDNDQKLENLEPPAMRLFRGGIAGDPDSLVFLSIARTRVEGVVFKGDRRFGIGSRVRPRRSSMTEGEGIDIFVQESEVADEIPLPGEEFVCDVEGAPISRGPKLSSVVSEAKQMIAQGALSTGSARWVINMAIETDFELYQNSGSSSTNVNTFITNLIGAMSTIYNRELTAEVQISYLGIHTTAADPFAIVPGTSGTWNGMPAVFSSTHALLEFGDRWHNSPPSANARSTTALISGKPQMAGVAWVDVLCDSDGFLDPNIYPEPYKNHWAGRYSFNGGIDPPADLAVPNPDGNAPVYTMPASNYWPLFQVSHETGHNVFSHHTHCRVLSPADQSTYGRQYVDLCHTGEGGCYSGATAVPGEKGTIMSYCHNRPGGGPNSRFIFGKTGEASYVITNDMKAAIQSATPNLSAITAPSSMNAGSNGTASVTNVGGLTYLWTITNGTISSGQGTSTINFTATSNPTTVRIKATNAAGCSITDAKSITVNVASFNPPTNVVATATTSTSVSITWTAPVGGTTPVRYNVYRSSNGSTYSLVNFVAHPLTVYADATAAANTAYLYKVRTADGTGATESTDSNRDLATTVIFTDDPLVVNATSVKATHITQLRTAVNAVRALASFGAGSYTDPTITAGTTTIKVAHVTDLRTALDQARAALTLPTISYGESINTSTTVKAVHVTELRNGVK